MTTKTSRVYNFGAGPAMLPEAILGDAQEELLNWKNLGISVLEIGHRTKEFGQVLQHAEQSLRELLDIPVYYKVLFLGGAARTQFAMIPLNFLQPDMQGAYLVSGIWSKMAFEESKRLKNACCLATTEPSGFTTVPNANQWILKEEAAYLYYTPNETVNGTRFSYIPDSLDKPLIADMTSCLLSEPVNIDRYGLIFAGAQKNIANAGLTLVIIREDLLHTLPALAVPSMLDYKIHARHDSLYATPPVFNCYLADKMFDWIQTQGGVQALYQQNMLKASALYDYIDSSNFYNAPVEKNARSLMNVCFKLPRLELEESFLKSSEHCGLYALKGHRLVGGLRASLYNAMPMAGVEALICFMMQFAKEHSL